MAVAQPTFALGIAGCTGISLTLVDRKKQGLIPFIERRAGLKFERVGAPQPADMAGVAGDCLALRSSSFVTSQKLRASQLQASKTHVQLKSANFQLLFMGSSISGRSLAAT